MTKSTSINVYVKQTHKVGAIWDFYTVVKGINSEVYDLYKLARVIRAMIPASQKRVDEDRSVMCFSGSHQERVTSILETMGFI